MASAIAHVNSIPTQKMPMMIKARNIATEKIDETSVQIWFSNFYDKNWKPGTTRKREGIHPYIVLPLIMKSIPHMDWYSRTIKEFAYINKNDGWFPIRVILQEKIDRQMLNVVIEVHFKELNVIELLVITATNHADFMIKDDQYSIVFQGNKSQLMKQENGMPRLVSSN